LWPSRHNGFGQSAIPRGGLPFSLLQTLLKEWFAHQLGLLMAG